MSMLERLNWFRPPDLRPEGEIDADIAEELTAHLEACIEDLIAEGLPADEAEREARRRFGDFEATLAACRRVKLEDRIMSLRLNYLLLLVVVPALGLLLFTKTADQRAVRFELDQAMASQDVLLERLNQSEVRAAELASRIELVSAAEPEAERAPTSTAEWLERYLEQPDDWGHGLALTSLLAKTEGQRALGTLLELWGDLPQPHREQAFKPFVFGGSAQVLELLAVGARDPDGAVRGRAFQYLRQVAFRDFSSSPGAFEAWWEQHRDLPMAEVVERNARLLVPRLELLAGDELSTELRLLGKPHSWMSSRYRVDLVGIMCETGALRLAERWLDCRDAELGEFACEWLAELGLDEGLQRDLLLPQLAVPELAGHAATALGQRGNTWAVQPLIEYLMEQAQHGRSATFFYPAASALGEIGDPSAIPELIAIVAAHDEHESVYGIGYYALRNLTGVQYDGSHDGAWWVSWWAKYRQRFPADVAAREIPVVRFDD